MKPRTDPLLKRPVIRILVIWVIQTVALLIMAALMSSVTVTSIEAALLAAAVIGILNALLWPLLSYVLLPFAVLTLGLAALLLNGFIVYLAAYLLKETGFTGFIIDGFWAAFWLSIGLTAINIIFSSLLTIDDDSAWYRNSVKRKMQRTAKPEPTDVPGIIFLEIDGLAKPILEKAMAEGNAPTLKQWIDSGSHTLSGWETDTSSQTSASQAGILHGNNRDIPAFRWFDKASGQLVASSNAKILPIIESDRSDGDGLLADQGASRGNLFSGDATFVMATASAIRDKTKFHTSDFQAFFASPYNAARTLILFVWDVILEMRQFRWARKHNVQPILDRHHRGFPYPFIRAAMTVLMRELNINTLLGDLFAGRPVAYATFVGYDEIAHHSGILDPGAFDVLRKLDAQFARLISAAKEAPRPYHFVVLSDHGQTGGATFKQRYGYSLEELTQQLMEEKATVGGVSETGEGMSVLNFYLSDTIQNESSATSKMMARAFKGQTVEGDLVLDEHSRADIVRQTSTGEQEQPQPDVIAVASGNLGVISFTKWPNRMTLEEIEAAFPAVIPGLVEHEGVGFVMVRSEKHGPLAIGGKGVYYLAEDRFEGENPLALFSPNAPAHLRRTDSFSNCPDILVNSFYDPKNNEGCAFEELIGFHGGMGGTQNQPFILHPTELKVEGDLVGAASIYHLGKNWLQQLQQSTAS
ncbi:MAG: phage holin family protein [Caldilineales bacterium]|nr:phage holin family protein [Caldilineales bacterium]